MNYKDMSSTYNKKLYKEALVLVGIITGNNPITGRFGRKIPVKNQFKFYALKNPEVLFYPCKPNTNDYITSPKPEDYSTPTNPAVSSFVYVENELNATLYNGKKYLPDMHCPFPLTQNLQPTALSHSTLLDFVFANAKKGNVAAECLKGFLELLASKPSFKKSFPDGGLAQAVSCSSSYTSSQLRPELLRETYPSNYGIGKH